MTTGFTRAVAALLLVPTCAVIDAVFVTAVILGSERSAFMSLVLKSVPTKMLNIQS